MALVTLRIAINYSGFVIDIGPSLPGSLKTRLIETGRHHGVDLLTGRDQRGVSGNRLPLHALLNWVEALGYKLETVSYSIGCSDSGKVGDREALIVFRRTLDQESRLP